MKQLKDNFLSDSWNQQDVTTEIYFTGRKLIVGAINDGYVME
jgi:hypothetical protein